MYLNGFTNYSVPAAVSGGGAGMNGGRSEDSAVLEGWADSAELMASIQSGWAGRPWRERPQDSFSVHLPVIHSSRRFGAPQR